MHMKTPWKTVKMAPIYDFPRAVRAEHGHGAKKVLAGVRFQWTDTQNDICIGRADKFSGWEPLSERSLFRYVFNDVEQCSTTALFTARADGRSASPAPLDFCKACLWQVIDASIDLRDPNPN